MLGDGFLEKRKPKHNSRLRIDQSYPSQLSYVNSFYNLFSNISGLKPRVNIRKPDKRTGKIYSSIAFKTYNLPCLNEFHNLFYKNSGLTHTNGEIRFIKVVPFNIQTLLTTISLAHWVRGDGYITKDKTVIICSENFSKDEINLLISALADKFGILASAVKRISSSGSVNSRIKISQKSINKFVNLIERYFVQELFYKIKIDD